MILDTSQLRSFVAVAETSSFTRAASLVNLTQPAISLQIKRLEDQVGRKLIERGPSRKVELTADGELLLGFARKILSLHREAEGLLSTANVSGTVRFGAPEYFDNKILALLLAQFRRQHPAVSLEVTISLGPEVRALVDSGALDVAIVNVEVGENLGTVLSRDKRVWVSGQEFTFEAEKPLPLVLFPPTCSWRRLALDALERAERSWVLALSSSGVSGLVTATEAGLGVSVMAARSVVSPLQIVSGPLGLPALPDFEYQLVESSSAPTAARRLAFSIRAVFGLEED
ncbi:LysR substrate-binding domain-containing protein [Hyphomicrobium sp. CS1GBMeth3]|uniref:LysR substrate-binding domain-containing protein n=1 Tax=Hyphomicrobium sp. CS1GBMeth3 TaxID=1892845 RepID=UPI0009319234|nr:LysR substrate-binding domain-containing protein [Hyphomicrobium sp. CS1GBMeth3]